MNQWDMVKFEIIYKLMSRETKFEERNMNWLYDNVNKQTVIQKELEVLN